MQRTILMVTNNYTPYSGGVVSSVQVTADALRKKGNRVIVVTLDFLGTGSHEQDVIRLACPIRFKYCNNHMAIPFMPRRALQRLIETYQPDIVHVHHPFLLGPIAQSIAQKKNIPVVFTYHTLYEQYLHYVPLPQFFTRPLLRKAVHDFCQNVEAVVVPSKSIQSHIAQQGIQAAHVASTGISSHYMRETLQLKTIDAVVELVSVSRFMPEKNIWFLLDVIKQLGSGYCLTLIGYGAQQQELAQYAYGTLQLSEEQVQFIIKPPKEAIARWYQRSHMFVFASQSETQGLVLAESMAAGTPVVALRGPGVVDIVADGANGFIVDSVQQMAERIAHIAADQKLYATLQQGAFETAKRYYPEEAIKNLLAVYENLIQ